MDIKVTIEVQEEDTTHMLKIDNVHNERVVRQLARWIILTCNDVFKRRRAAGLSRNIGDRCLGCDDCT